MKSILRGNKLTHTYNITVLKSQSFSKADANYSFYQMLLPLLIKQVETVYLSGLFSAAD